MRIFNRLLTVAGVLALLTGIALAADKPQVITAEQGVGPGGVVESTVDFNFQEPDWTGPPRTTKGDVKKEKPEHVEMLARLKNLQLDMGHDVATVLQAPPLSRSGVGGVAAAPALQFSFEGITQGAGGGFIPPDPIMAAGPNHVIVAVNLRWSIYSKTGTQQFTSSFSAWFASVNTRSEGYSDPKVIYDHYSGRWIVMCIGFGNAGNPVGSYFVSVSDDSDPNGFWYKWATPGELNGVIVTTNFPDYPGIGYDSSEAVYLTSRQFSQTGGGFQGAKVRVLKKSELYRTDLTSPPLTYSDFVNMTDLTTGTNVLTMDPAMCRGSIRGNFVVGSVNFSGSAHDIWKINNPAGAATMTRVATIPLGGFSAPPNAAQPPPGCGTAINTVDARITGEVVYQNGHLYYTFNHAHNFGSGTVAAIRYVKADTLGGVVDNIIYGADGEFMYFPNVAVAHSGNVAIGYSHSSTTAPEFASARYVGNFPTDLTQGVLRAGDGAYCLVAGGRNRWGDYSGCIIDPALPRRVWVYNEYATASNSWSTRTGYFSLTNHPPVISDPGAQTLDEGDSVTLNLTVADPDGENIGLFAVLYKPAYVTFTNLGGGQGTLKIAPGCSDAGVDSVKLVARDNASPFAADTIKIDVTILAINCAPVVAVSTADTIRLNQCLTKAVLITSSDPEAASVTISAGTVPAFATVFDSGGGLGSLSVAPGMGDLGPYSAEVTSSDGGAVGTLDVPVRVFAKGDLNWDDMLDATDNVLLLLAVFLGEAPPAGLEACDLDGDVDPTATDVVLLLNTVFLGDPLPGC